MRSHNVRGKTTSKEEEEEKQPNMPWNGRTFALGAVVRASRRKRVKEAHGFGRNMHAGTSRGIEWNEANFYAHFDLNRKFI